VSTYETCGLIGSVDVARAIKAGGWSATSVQEREADLLKWAQIAWKD
jgi:hypothetical protein